MEMEGLSKEESADESCCTVEGSTVLFQVLSTNCRSPIYIDDIQINSILDRDADLDCSIMLLNLAIANHCASESPELSKDTNEEQKRTAYTLLALAYGILVYRSEDVTPKKEASRSIILVAMLVVASLGTLCTELESHEEAEQHHERLQSLQRVYQELYQHVPTGRCCPAPAA